MNCKQFRELPDQEQKEYLGELVHAAMSSNWGYEAGKELISFVKMQGKFVGVKFNTEVYKDDIGIDRNGYETN